MIASNLLGQSLVEMVEELKTPSTVASFGRKNIAEENIEKGLDIWRNSIEKVLQEERKKVWKKIFLSAGKLEQKDMVGIKKSLVDRLWWMWVNMFTKGDEDVNREVNNGFFSNGVSEKNIAEFAEDKYLSNVRQKMIQHYLNKIEDLKLSGKKEDNDGYTIKEYRDEIKKLQGDNITSKPAIKQKTIDVDARQKKYEQIKDPQKRKITRELDLRRSKEEIRTKEAPLFMGSSDFGRIYVRKRLDYIGDVYTGKTRENMEDIFNTLNKGYEAGDTTLPNPIQKYFERYPMTKAQNVEDVLQPDGNVATAQQIRGSRIIAEQDIPIPGSKQKIAGKRIKPKATANLSDYQVTQLVDSVEKMFADDPKRKNKLLNNVNRIVSTELSAAYNMGRMHGMYRSGVKYVRWINDYEYKKTGRTCVACTARAMGRSRKAKLPDSLTGVYTLEEILTERQLVIPSHPHCLCWIRPLTNEENELIQNTAIPTTSQESLMTAMATTGVIGAGNINYGEEGQENRTNWYATAATIGVTAVAMGMAYWYLRRSFVAKDAARLLKTQGVNIAQRADERRLGDVKMPVSQEQLDASIKINEEAGLPDLATIKERNKNIPLINLEHLNPREQEIVLEHVFNPLSEKVALETGALERITTKTAQIDDAPIIREKLKLGREVFETTNAQIASELSGEDISDNLRTALETLQLRNNQEIVRITNAEEKLNKLTSDITQITYNPQDILNTYEQLSPELKQYFEKGLKNRNDKLEALYNEFNNKKLTRKDLIRINNYITQSSNTHKRKLAELQQYLVDNNLDENLLFKISALNDDVGIDIFTTIKEQQSFFQPRIEQLVRDVSLNKSKLNPSYRIKLKEEILNDPFITQTQMENIRQDNIPSMKDRTVVDDSLTKTVLNADQRVRTDALSKRRKAVKELNRSLSMLNKARGSDTTLIRDASDKILRKLNVDMDAFNSMDNKGRKAILDGVITQLKAEIYRLQYVEFAQYQKKWAMFGAPK